jgi:hypothetical protein
MQFSDDNKKVSIKIMKNFKKKKISNLKFPNNPYLKENNSNSPSQNT